MLTASCHCGAVKVQVPDKPASLTECNCSICRRYGALWAYYADADVQLIAVPGTTDDYIWGDKSQRFIRCKECGCIMQWKNSRLAMTPTLASTRVTSSLRNWAPSRLTCLMVRKPGNTFAKAVGTTIEHNRRKRGAVGPGGSLRCGAITTTPFDHTVRWATGRRPCSSTSVRTDMARFLAADTTERHSS